MMDEEKVRLTKTVNKDTVPDELVRDLFRAGWQMRTNHFSHTLPSRFVYSLSNMFINMETEETLLMDDDKIYRVEIDDSKKVVVRCYGIDSIDSVLQPYYPSVDDLPKWVQERLAVLYLLNPYEINQDVEKVGRRISRTVFWIYPEQ